MGAVSRAWAWLSVGVAAVYAAQRPAAGWAVKTAWWLAATTVVFAFARLSRVAGDGYRGPEESSPSETIRSPAPAPDFLRLAETVRAAVRDARYAQGPLVTYLGGLILGDPEGAASPWRRRDGFPEQARRALEEALGGRVPWNGRRRPPAWAELEHTLARVEEAYERARRERSLR